MSGICSICGIYPIPVFYYIVVTDRYFGTEGKQNKLHVYAFTTSAGAELWSCASAGWWIPDALIGGAVFPA